MQHMPDGGHFERWSVTVWMAAYIAMLLWRDHIDRTLDPCGGGSEGGATKHTLHIS